MERPALVQRAPYDGLQATAGKAGSILADAAVRARSPATAIEEMAEAEKVHGHISRRQDTDPFLNEVREAVAAEAKAMGDTCREGSASHRSLRNDPRPAG
jgi:ABC-type sugar transport system substrate-binding protein